MSKVRGVAVSGVDLCLPQEAAQEAALIQPQVAKPREQALEQPSLNSLPPPVSIHGRQQAFHQTRLHLPSAAQHAALSVTDQWKSLHLFIPLPATLHLLQSAVPAGSSSRSCALTSTQAPPNTQVLANTANGSPLQLPLQHTELQRALAGKLCLIE